MDGLFWSLPVVETSKAKTCIVCKAIILRVKSNALKINNYNEINKTLVRAGSSRNRGDHPSELRFYENAGEGAKEALIFVHTIWIKPNSMAVGRQRIVVNLGISTRIFRVIPYN